MKPRTTTNRILLALAGLLLLGGGLLVLTAGLDLYRRWSLGPPSGWPLTGPHDVLLGAGDRERWSSQGWWWWPAVIAALAVVALLALGWLLAQLRRPRPGRLPVWGTSPGGEPEEGVEVRDGALGDAIAAEAAGLPGVVQAGARMSGRAARPEARVDLALGTGGSPRETLRALADGPLERARRSAGWRRLPADVRFSVARHGPRRAE
ncbi:alkaline shock response membrane anchor protein AmaP [Streptomyces sp. NPDC001380]|uniref:alkaline shock response membrane anchor protein AmaP n=1 Tax=Streptomyces sp. NPDC001380 TaxID=3364566 RepID=UPI0036C90D31